MLIGIPVAFGVALFITELCPNWLKRPLSTMIELLAAIPSIIFGIWGLFVLAPFVQERIEPALIDTLGAIPFVGALFEGPPLGIGVLTAGFILSIMVLPFISAIMRDVLETVPPMLKESAYGLGATTTEVVWRVALPYARIGVIGGILLGLGRALGETMAVTFVIGNSHHIHASILQPGTTISAALANEFTEAVGDLYPSSLIALGLILFLITFIVLACAKLLLIRLERQGGG
jgi:phosphate transport system permease protein